MSSGHSDENKARQKYNRWNILPAKNSQSMVYLCVHVHFDYYKSSPLILSVIISMSKWSMLHTCICICPTGFGRGGLIFPLLVIATVYLTMKRQSTVQRFNTQNGKFLYTQKEFLPSSEAYLFFFFDFHCSIYYY